eukprot:5886180-Pyramimonas_sp.AAC.1
MSHGRSSSEISGLGRMVRIPRGQWYFVAGAAQSAKHNCWWRSKCHDATTTTTTTDITFTQTTVLFGSGGNGRSGGGGGGGPTYAAPSFSPPPPPPPPPHPLQFIQPNATSS